MENEREKYNEEFKENFVKYRQLIRKVAYDYTGDYNAAQDICQETFMRFYDFQGDMPEEKIRPWLVVVAANIAKDMLKKGGKYKEIVGLPETEKLAGLMPVKNDVEEHLKRLGDRELFTTALSSLREKNEMWYDMVVLVKCLGIPRKKVAREYGLAVTTVDGYLRRAREWLVENFGEEYRDL